jgi:lipopolysaccharide heptosyltransferase II
MTVKRKKAALVRETAISLFCKGLALLWRLPSFIWRKPLTIAPNARILIIKPCCLGDVVYTTPVIAALRSAYPQAYLAYAVSRWSRPIVESNPQLNQIIDTGVNGSSFSPQEYLALVRRIRRERFDVAVVLDRSPLLAVLPSLASIKVRAGINSRGRGFALNIFSKLERSDPIKHEAELYLDVVRSIGIHPQNPRTHFFPSAPADQTVRQKAAEKGLEIKVLPPTRGRVEVGGDAFSFKLAIIHPGGGTNPDTKVLSKRWQAENFGAIAAKLCEQGWQVAVIGAKEDTLLAHTVVEAVPVGNPIYNLAGMLDIAEIAALMQYARLYLGNDTGLTHLATAFEAHVIAIFGPSHPLAYRPYSPKGIAVAPPGAELNPHLPLEEYQNIAAEHGGIAAVTVERVWNIIELSLQKPLA